MMDSIADLMQQATALHERGQLEEAAQFYSRVLAREPEHADALHLTGVVAHQRDRNEDAVALITRAITKNPRAPAFHNNLGLALTALGQTAKAEAAYQEALALVPEFADALLNLGSLRAGQGSFEEAATLLERAVAADSGVPQAHYYLGCARFALTDARGALDAFQQAASLGADFAEVHYRIGGAHAAVGETAQAIAGYVRALDRDDDHSGALHGLLESLDMLPAGVDAALLETVVAPLLRAKSVNPRTLGHGAACLLERKHALVAEHGSTPSAESLCDGLLDDGIARLYLQRTVNVSAPLERLLTRCRARWLADADHETTMAQSRWDGAGAVAIQCFLNEFVWAVTPEEEHAVAVLERHIIDVCSSAASPDQAIVPDLLVSGPAPSPKFCAYPCTSPWWSATWMRASPPVQRSGTACRKRCGCNTRRTHIPGGWQLPAARCSTSSSGCGAGVRAMSRRRNSVAPCACCSPVAAPVWTLSTGHCIWTRST
jgi:tetratricopeptide (TPR) repeat protein